MFRRLIASDAPKIVFGQGAVVSVAAHVALVGAAVAATLPRDKGERADDPSSIPFVKYLLPPDHAPSPGIRQETIHWVPIGSQGGGNEGTAIADAASKSVLAPALAGSRPDQGGKSEPVVPDLKAPDVSDVMTVLDVDSAVTRYDDSAAPAYPPKMLSARLEGSAAVQFIVDTTGFPDTTSFRVLEATQPDFARAVREALPHMRFRPAVAQHHKVRQLVQQLFRFKIDSTLLAAPRPVSRTKPDA